MSSTYANCLLNYAVFAILRHMTDGGRRRRRKARPTFKGRTNELGALLADLRVAKGLSLREVEEATDKAVSNACLSQLENGKIKKPSPNVLHSLAEVYAVPYEALMEKAGCGGSFFARARVGLRIRRIGAVARARPRELLPLINMEPLRS
jgi:transcriptional regulator with XRE-family HTH domain